MLVLGMKIICGIGIMALAVLLFCVIIALFMDKDMPGPGRGKDA